MASMKARQEYANVGEGVDNSHGDMDATLAVMHPTITSTRGVRIRGGEHARRYVQNIRFFCCMRDHARVVPVSVQGWLVLAVHRGDCPILFTARGGL